MRWTRADNWQPQSNIDRSIKADQFHGNVSLVMVHRDNAVKLTSCRTANERVDRKWAGHVAAGCPGRHDGWLNHCLFLIPKQAMFATVRVQCGDGNG